MSQLNRRCVWRLRVVQIAAEQRRACNTLDVTLTGRADIKSSVFVIKENGLMFMFICFFAPSLIFKDKWF